MRYGKLLHISKLQLGDVVRMVHGPGRTTKPGDQDDFREGYDAMTVVAVDSDFVTFHRPHIELYQNDGPRYQHVECAIEVVSAVSRKHEGLYYELLAWGPHMIFGKTHWE